MREAKRLPDAEFAVMQEVWAAPETPVPSAWLTERLADRWKATSVLTFLSGCVKKGSCAVKSRGK